MSLQINLIDHLCEVFKLDRVVGYGLSGFDSGSTARKSLNLDIFDNMDESMEIIVETKCHVITTSFFMGLFADSIYSLGEDGFRDKYKITGDVYIKNSIEDGIDRICSHR